MSKRLTSKQELALGNLMTDIETLLSNFEGEINSLLTPNSINKSPLPKNMKKRLSKVFCTIDNAFVNLSIVNDDIEEWEESLND